MLGNHRLKNLGAPRFECGQGACLVALHEAAVADRISGQNGGKPALGAFFGHSRPLLSKGAVQQIVGARRTGCAFDYGNIPAANAVSTLSQDLQEIGRAHV